MLSANMDDDAIPNQSPVKYDVGGVLMLSLPEPETLPSCSIALPDTSEHMRPLKISLEPLKNDPVFRVIVDSPVDKVKESIKRYGIQYQNKSGFYWIHAATALGQLDIVKILAKIGGSINSVTKSRKTVLHIAALTNHVHIVSWLVAHGLDINATDEKGTSALQIAALGGFSSIMDNLLTHGAQVNVKDKQGRTPLMAASQQGHSELVKLLLASGADVEQKTSTGKQALFFACMNQNREIAQILLESQKFSDGDQVLIWCALKGLQEMVELLVEHGQDLNCQDSDGRTPLMASSQGGHIKVFQILLDHNADVNMISHHGETSLHFAAFHNHCDILTILLDKVEDLNYMDKNGNTALMYAASQEEKSAIECLVFSDIDINAQNRNGKTALMIAAESGHSDIVNILLQKNASPEIVANNGLNAAQFAQINGYSDIAKMLKENDSRRDQNEWTDLVMAVRAGNISQVEELNKNGVSVEQYDNQGVTPLMIAALYGHVNLIEWLLRKGARPESQNSHGRTALAYALAGGHITIADILLGWGLSLNETSDNGETMLYHAASVGSYCTVEYLVRLGSDVNLRNIEAKTPLMVSAEKGHLTIVAYLEQAGADIKCTCDQGFTATDYAFVEDRVEVHNLLTNKSVEEDSNVRINEGALVAASDHGEIDTVRHLLNAGTSVNYRDPINHGTTALCRAAVRFHKDIVDLLLEHGADIHAKCLDGEDAFLAVCRKGNTALVNLFIQHGANVNTRDICNRTPLMYASELGEMTIVKILLANNALKNLRDTNCGASALLAAVAKGHLDIVSMLLEAHACVDILDFDGHTPLLLACLRGFLPVVEVLVQYNAEVNFSDKLDRTPLMAAAQHGHLSVVQYLVQNGASVNMVSVQDVTARDIAMAGHHYEVADWLETHMAESRYSRLGKSKYERIIDMNPRQMATIVESRENTAQKGNAQAELRDMCENNWGFEDAISFTIKNGANVNHVYRDGKTALILSAENNAQSHVTWLLKFGAEVNVQDKEGRSALIYAVHNNNMEMIQLLLQHNAFVGIQDKNGQSLLGYASENKNAELVEFLDNLLRTDNEVLYNEPYLHQTLANAVSSGQVEEVKKILSQRSLLPGDIEHSTVMSCSHLTGEDGVNMVHLLHSYGIDIFYVDNDGGSLLQQAISVNNIAVFSALLELRKGSVGLDDNFVVESVMHGNPEMTKLLINSMKDIDASVITLLFKFIAYNNDMDLLADCVCRKWFLRVNIQELGSFILKAVLNHEIAQEAFRHLPPKTSEDVQNSSGQILQSVWELLESNTQHLIGKNMRDQILVTAIEKGEYEVASILAEDVTQLDQYVICTSHGEGGIEPDVMNEELYDLNFEQERQEAAVSLDRTMDKMYSMFTKTVIRESPTYIKGFSRDRQAPKIYLYVSEGAIQKAKSFVIDKFTRNDPLMSILGFEYIVQPTSARFLMPDPYAASSSAADFRGTEKVQAGSILLNRSNWGTLGCLMYEHNQGSPNRVWMVTVGHILLDHKDAVDQHVSNRVCQIFTKLRSFAQGSNTEDHLVGERYWAALQTILDRDENYQFIDLALIPLHDDIQSDKYIMEIPRMTSAPSVYVGSDAGLMGRKVAKIGVTTKYTEGVIVAPNLGYIIENVSRPGMFAVLGEDETFAKPGDSGSLIIDTENNCAIGLLSAVHTGDYFANGRFYTDLALCLRLDLCLEYAKNNWNLVLSFNNPTVSVPVDRLQPSENPPQLRIEDRTQNLVNEATFFAQQHLSLLDQIERLNITVKMHKEARSQNEASLALRIAENSKQARMIEDLRRQLQEAENQGHCSAP